jgi:hypothetical protein
VNANASTLSLTFEPSDRPGPGDPGSGAVAASLVFAILAELVASSLLFVAARHSEAVKAMKIASRKRKGKRSTPIRDEASLFVRTERGRLRLACAVENIP